MKYPRNQHIEHLLQIRSDFFKIVNNYLVDCEFVQVNVPVLTRTLACINDIGKEKSFYIIPPDWGETKNPKNLRFGPNVWTFNLIFFLVTGFLCWVIGTLLLFG